MKSIDDLVNELNQNTNYEEILIEIINIKENNHIKKIFEEISQNNDLTPKQKEKIYNSILDYSNEISKNFKKRIENIHKQGFKEGSVVSFLIDNITRDNLTKRDVELDLLLKDFILERLKNQNLFENNKEYIEKRNEIEKIMRECKIIGKLNKLEDLYEFIFDLKEIQAYKIGFRDALNFVVNKVDKG